LYFAAPQSQTRLPVILVVQEIFGVHPHIRDVCRRLAHRGYLAVAPQLYARQGDAAQFKEIADLMAGLVSKVPDAQVLADLDGAVDWAGAYGGDLSRLGITGFCWGGRMTWLYTAHSSAVKAAVAWYGRLEGAYNDNTPRHPVDIAADLKAPVLGLYGGQDTGIPMSQVQAMQAALAAAAAQGHAAAQASHIAVFEDAPHAFYADYRPSYRADLAAPAFERALDWFAAQGVA
jgi:carboxymethylenebutenolidase